MASALHLFDRSELQVQVVTGASVSETVKTSMERSEAEFPTSIPEEQHHDRMIESPQQLFWVAIQNQGCKHRRWPLLCIPHETFVEVARLARHEVFHRIKIECPL